METLRPDRSVGEGLYLGNLSDFAVPDPFACLPNAGLGSSLVTHLGAYMIFVGKFGEETCLVDGMNERFLAIYVLAGCNRLCSNDSVSVVSSSHHYGVSLVEEFVVHLAVVAVSLRIRITVEDVGGIFGIHVAESDDFLGLHRLEVCCTSSSDSHTENLEFLLGWSCRLFLLSGCCKQITRCHREPDGCCCSCLQESAS